MTPNDPFSRDVARETNPIGAKRTHPKTAFSGGKWRNVPGCADRAGDETNPLRTPPWVTRGSRQRKHRLDRVVNIFLALGRAVGAVAAVAEVGVVPAEEPVVPAGAAERVGAALAEQVVLPRAAEQVI